MNVDWDRINSFIDEEDAEEQEWLKDMIVTLISSFEERLIELDAIMSKRDNVGLIAILHQMKGITSNFGLERLRQIISAAEVFAKANNTDSALREVSKLSPIWEETRVELKAKLGI